MNKVSELRRIFSATAWAMRYEDLNAMRAALDLDPIPDGNTYWRPLAWAPLGQLTNPDTGGGDGSGKKTKEQEQLESEERTTKKAAIVHNTHVLAALADKSPAEAAAALSGRRHKELR